MMSAGFTASRCCNAVVKWRSVASTRMHNTCCTDTILLEDTYNSLIISGKDFYLVTCFVTNLVRVRLLSTDELSDMVSVVALFLHFRIASVITVCTDWHCFFFRNVITWPASVRTVYLTKVQFGVCEKKALLFKCVIFITFSALMFINGLHGFAACILTWICALLRWECNLHEAFSITVIKV
jgi:hypothetical protein